MGWEGDKNFALLFLKVQRLGVRFQFKFGVLGWGLGFWFWLSRFSFQGFRVGNKRWGMN